MKFAFTATGFLIALLCVGQRHVRADEKAYPRADLLIEANRLAASQIIDSEYAADFTILDARPRTDYLRGHVPNALCVNHDEWATAFGHGQDADGWSKRIGSLGIGPKTKVVVYDDNLNKDAARIWWILRYWGVEDVRLLNGGWKAWKDFDAKSEHNVRVNGKSLHITLYSIETTETIAKPVDFVAKPRPERLATKEQLLRSLANGKLQIVDARSEKEFCGIDKMRNIRAGAIPGAKQLEWVDLIDKKTHLFKPAAELRRLFASAGINLNRPTATHCQSGGRASLMAFGLELMGSKDVSNYYPSWAEWSSAEDTPVIPGTPKEK